MSSHKGIFKNSEIETISSKLKFISTLKKGQKISVSTNSIQDNTYWTSLMRSMTGESREKVYNFISDVVQDSLSILESLSNSNNEYDIKVCKNLITDLIFLTPGLQNLQETYKHDKMYVSKIMTLLENLEVKIKELCDKRDIDYDEIYNETRAKIEREQQLTQDSIDTKPLPETKLSDQSDNKIISNNDTFTKVDEVKLNKCIGECDDSTNCVPCNEKKTNTKLNNIINEIILNVNDVNDVKDVNNHINNLNDDDEKKTIEKLEDLHSSVKLDVDLEIPHDISNSSDNSDDQSIINTTTTGTTTSLQIEKDRETFRAKYLQNVTHDLLLMTTNDKTAPNGEQILFNQQNSFLNKNAARRKKKKHAYQYDNYYMSTPDDIDDITLCNTELQKGLIH